MNLATDKRSVNGWELIDNESIWYWKPLDDVKHVFIKAIWLDTTSEDEKAKNAKDPQDNYIVVSDTIDIGSMTVDELEMAVSGYYHSIADMEEQLGLPFDALIPQIAAYAFDSATSFQYQTDLLSREEAEKFILDYMEEN